MSVKYFSIDWEIESTSDDKVYAIHHYTNSIAGDFHITETAHDSFSSGDDYKILSKIFEFKNSRKKLIICLESEKSFFTSNNIVSMSFDDIFSKFPVNLFEKQNSILVLLYNINPNPGEDINVTYFYHWMFYSRNDSEMIYLFELMIEKELIKCRITRTSGGGAVINLPIRIQENGWLFIEEKMKSVNSKKVFIAMWFDDSMNKAFLEICRSLESLGFIPFRIDKKEYNNEISGEILYEIRKCRFMIADVTNQRHGVYFEAGYAIGLGIPVIWSCRSDDLINIHFDTRQYNHIVWKQESELFEKISNRVKGTIL